MGRGGTWSLAVVLVGVLLTSLGTPATAHVTSNTQDHGTMSLEFQEATGGCNVTVLATGVPVGQLAFQIQEFAQGPFTVHEEQVNGTPEEGEDTFSYQVGPMFFEIGEFGGDDRIFRLVWDNESHGMQAYWGGDECAQHSFLRVHETMDGPAVDEVEGCTFFVEGRFIDAESGTLHVEGQYNDRVFATNLTADDMTPEENATGNRFMVEVTVDLSGDYFASFRATGEDGSEGIIFFDVLGCSTEPPACPPDFRVDVEAHANVIWWDAVQGAHAYRVYRATEGGDMELILEEEHPASLAHDTDVTNGTTYTYLVVAVGEMGESEGCPTVTVTVPPLDDEPVDGEEPPMQPVCPPVDLMTIANGDGTIDVSADGLSGNATLLRAAGDGTFVEVATLTPDAPAYHDTDTEVGTTYTYRLVLDGEVCAEAEATAIPVFPSIAAAGAALTAGLVGYAALSRRRRV